LMDYQQADYSKDPWVFLSPEGYSLFQKLKTGAKSELQNIGEITVGLQTSADDIYIFVPTNIGDEFVQFERNGVLFEIETAITRPCLKDQRFKGFDQPEANAQMIFPYKIVDEKAVVLDESEFQSQFPKCWEYLIKFKERLEARSIVGKNPKWYQFGRSQGLTKFHDKDKLIWPVLSLTPNYGYDTKNIFFTGGGNGPYYSFLSGDHYSIFYILGIISHPAIEAMVKAYASHFGGGYYSHGKQFIQNLPIKTIDFSKSEEVDVYNQIIDHVQRIIELRGELIGTRVPSEKEVLNRRLKHQEGKLIGIVCLLYGITELEMEVVRGKRYLIDHTIE
jgi:hypothetical protein